MRDDYLRIRVALRHEEELLGPVRGLDVHPYEVPVLQHGPDLLVDGRRCGELEVEDILLTDLLTADVAVLDDLQDPDASGVHVTHSPHEER